MDKAERLALTTKGTVEIIQKTELHKLLDDKPKPRAYWGFEPSGKQANACTE